MRVSTLGFYVYASIGQLQRSCLSLSIVAVDPCSRRAWEQAQKRGWRGREGQSCRLALQIVPPNAPHGGRDGDLARAIEIPQGGVRPAEVPYLPLHADPDIEFFGADFPGRKA